MENIIFENTCKLAGKNVKRYRLERGFSQAKLAEKSGLSNNCICSIENCKDKTFLSSLGKVAYGLGIPSYYLLMPEEPEKAIVKIATKDILRQFQECIEEIESRYLTKE